MEVALSASRGVRRGLALAERGEAVQAIRFKAGMYNRRVCIAAGA